MAIGERIREYRLRKFMTQKELADALNISTQAVSKWERGGAPDISLIVPLANLLDVSPNELLEFNENSECTNS